MMPATAFCPAVLEPWSQCELSLAGRRLALDAGSVVVLSWQGQADLAGELAILYALVFPVVRYAGGALISDLSLSDNLMLESALRGSESPSVLLPEIDALFTRMECPIDWPALATTLPESASSNQQMQVRVGRALLADPDVLLVDASDWDESATAPRQFSQSFSLQYPWRTLVWACHDEISAARLRLSLQDPAS